MVLHDLNLACRYAHNVVAIKDQKSMLKDSLNMSSIAAW